MVTAYSANDMAIILQNNWSLAGSLNKSYSPTMSEIVLFWGHANITRLDPTKYVIVSKVNPAGQENIIQHPEWAATTDVYTITCKYRNPDSSDAGINFSETDIQAMSLEVVRILKTQFDPTVTVGVFMQTDYKWLNRDDLTMSDVPELQRTLQLTLTRVVSRLTTVFKGYGGILVFDVSNSQGVNLPGQNYAYTEAYDVQIEQGYSLIEEQVSQHPAGSGIPVFFRGKYNGFMTCKIKIKKVDIGTNNTNALNRIFQPLVSNELPRVTFIWSETDTEVSPATYNTSNKLYVTRLKETHTTESISEWILQARIYQPSTWSIT